MSEFPLAYDGMLFVSWCHSNWHTCFTWIACVRYNEQYYCLKIAHHIVISTHMASNSTLPCLHKHTDPRAYTLRFHVTFINLFLSLTLRLYLFLTVNNTFFLCMYVLGDSKLSIDNNWTFSCSTIVRLNSIDFYRKWIVFH